MYFNRGGGIRGEGRERRKGNGKGKEERLEDDEETKSEKTTTFFFVIFKIQENEYEEMTEAVQEAVSGVSDVVLDTVSLPFR